MTSAEPFPNRPIRELLGRVPGYSFAGDGVHTAVGNHTRTALDLPMPSPLLSWARTYNSRGPGSGGLGRGWTSTMDARLDFESSEGIVLHHSDGRALTFPHRPDGTYGRATDLPAELREQAESWQLHFFSGEVWEFDAAGRMRSRAARGQRVDCEYDSAGLLISAVHSAGFRLELSYGAGGLLRRVVADDGRAVHYEYETAGVADAASPDIPVLSSATTPGTGATRYDSTPAGLLARVTDADGVVLVRNDFADVASGDPADGRVVQQVLAGEVEVRFSYDDANRTTAVHGPTGARTEFGHAPDGRPVRVTDALGGTTSLRRDEDGRLIEGSTAGGTAFAQHYDEAGDLVTETFGDATTSWTHDEAHRITSVTDPAGLRTLFTYHGDERIPATISDPSGGITHQVVQDGKVLRTRRPAGGIWWYEHDDRGNLVTATAPDGANTRYEHDAAGRRVAETNALGERIEYRYDDAGRLVGTTGRDGIVRQRRYSAAGRLLSTSDQEGTRSSREYDAAGRLAATTGPLGTSTRYGYDRAGNLATVTGPAGEQVTLAHDELNRITAVTDAVGATTRYEYDAEGNNTSVSSPAGTVRKEFDQRGNAVVETDPGGAVTTVDYDALDRPVAVTDPAGATWRTQYDDTAGVVTETGPDGAVAMRRHGPDGRTSVRIDPLGRRTEYHYDDNGRITTITDPEGGRTRFEHDAAGRTTAVRTPAGLVTRFRYEHGRLAAVVDPRGWITRYRYDSRGRRTEVINPSGMRTRFGYDAAGRLVSRTDARGGTTRHHYDELGNLTELVDAKGVSTRFTHDAAGRRTSVTDPLGRTTRREYDAAGNLATLIEPSGLRQHFEYDARGNLLRRHGEDGAEVRYTYDAAGRRKSMSDSTGTTGYDYDTAGRLRTVTFPDEGRLVADYDAAGQRTTLHYPDGAAAHYRYDGNGRLVGLRDSDAGEAVYAVDPDGRLVTEQLPGGWSRRYRYEGGLLAEFAENRANVPAIRTELSHDADGRITGQVDHVGADATGAEEVLRHAFGYDPGGQLVSISSRTADGSADTRIAYDIAGNRTAVVREGARTGYLYDAADQLVAVEQEGRRIAYRYDPAGRLLEQHDGDRRQVIDYDGLGLPRVSTRTTAWSSERTELRYNGDGLLTELESRIGDDAAPTSVDYRWSVGDRLPQILDQRVRTDARQDDSAPVGGRLADARFTYGQGRAFATTAQNSVVFARDAFGSTVRTEQTRPWAQAERYGAFGALEAEPDRAPLSAPEIPRFGYRGELSLASDVYLRARFLDGAVGRFHAPDPVALIGASSQANNRYQYAENDPLNRTDPTGAWAVTDARGGLLAQLAATGIGGCGNCSGDPGNGLERHWKCFQDQACFRVRGYRLTEDALDADPDTLKDLYYSRRPERAAQALTINKLNAERAGGWDSFWGGVLDYTPVSERVDWEVGPRGTNRFRVDITTEERDIFEVKRWAGPATAVEVTGQLNGYVLSAGYWGVDFEPSDELTEWASGFDVTTGFFSYFETPWTNDTVFVWGLGNPDGHIYFAENDRASDDVQSKAYSEGGPLTELPEPVIPIPIRPVPVPVVP